jgi:hypothetical protein
MTQSIEKHVKELSEVQTYMNRTVAKEAILHVLINSAMITPEAQQKLEDGKDGYVPVISDGDLSHAVHVLDYGTNSSQYSFQVARQELLETIRSISGVAASQRGWHEPGVETAEEARMLEAAGDVRNTMRKRAFSRFASRTISKLLYIITLEYPPERIAAMAGIGPEYAPLIAAAGPFDATKFVVDYGMTAANSRQERLQKLMIFKSMVGDYLNPAVLARMTADVLDFDFTDELMVYQALGMNSNQGTSNIPTGNAALGIARSRMAPSGQQQLSMQGVS